MTPIDFFLTVKIFRHNLLGTLRIDRLQQFRYIAECFHDLRYKNPGSQIIMTPYSYHPTICFQNKLDKIQKQDPNGFLRINKVIERLLRNPEDADGRMRGTHHSRFKKYVGRRDYRLIYEWCALCHKASKKLEDRCEKCDEIDDNSVVFFDVFHKNEA